MTDHNPDTPLKTFLGGKYAQRPDGEAPMYMRHPQIDVEADAGETFLEFGDTTGFDTGTTPWTAVYTRTTIDEGTGDIVVEHSLDAAFSAPYVPTGTVVPADAMESDINLGSEIIPLDGTAKGLTIPAICNTAQMEFVGAHPSSYAKYSYDGDPIAGAFHRMNDGGFLTVHSPNMELLLATLGGDKLGALHVNYYYSPASNDHG